MEGDTDSMTFLIGLWLLDMFNDLIDISIFLITELGVK